ncbi:hypothetical protein [Mesorhizobium sp. A623]
MSDDILEGFGDLIKEIPEAEKAIRDHIIRRRRQVMAATAKVMDANARKTDTLRAELLACYIGTDSLE